MSFSWCNGVRVRFHSRQILLAATVVAVLLVAGSTLVAVPFAGATTSATISLSGTAQVGNSNNHYFVFLDVPPPVTGTAPAPAPTGTATVTDSLSGTCTAPSVGASWIPDGSGITTGSEVYSASCAIASNEPAGTKVSASYISSDYSTSASATNTLIVASSLALTATSFTNVAGSYSSTYTASLSVSSTVAPSGTLILNAGGVCTTSSWTQGLTTSGLTTYAAQCVVTSSSSFVPQAIASYSGSDYVVNGASYYPSLTLSGSVTQSGHAYTAQFGIPVGGSLPSGTVTITDNTTNTNNSCTTSTWTTAIFDGYNSTYVYARCTITTSEPAGTKVTASYSGPDFHPGPSNETTVANSFVVSATPPTLSSGVYTRAVTATLSIPTGDAAPNGSVSVSTAVSGVYCNTSSWGTPSVSSGVDSYSASCNLTSSSSYVGPINAYYGGIDYVVNEASYSNALELSGIITPTGQVYTTQIVVPSGSATPIGTVTVTDSAGDSCTTSSWTNDGTTGATIGYFEASCTITTSELAGTTVSAIYAGPDYSPGASNQLTVANSLTLSGSPVVSASNNSYTVTLKTPGDVTPTGTVIVSDSASGSCDAHLWSSAGPDSSGGQLFTSSCVITSTESSGTTVSATYGGLDYVSPPSNQLSVGTSALTQNSSTAASISNGAGFSFALGMTNGTGPFTFGETNSTYSGYITVSSSGVVTYVANTLATGSYTVSGTVTDAHGATGSWTFRLVVRPRVIVIQPTAPSGPTNAPAPTGLPSSSYGTPTSVTASSTVPITVAQSSGGATATLSVPAGALPSGTTVSIYPIVNEAPLVAQVPTGESYVASLAVSWQAPNGAAPPATVPITMTLTDPSLVVGDTMYELTSTGLNAIGVASANGSITITFSNDPTFVITANVLIAQSALSITSVSGTVRRTLSLITSGGSSTGAVTFSVTNGTATGCVISGDSLSAATAGTCLVTATKAADTKYNEVSSQVTPVNFIVALKATRVTSPVRTGESIITDIVGVGFFGQPVITGSVGGTRVGVLHDNGTHLTIRVTVGASTPRGVHTFTIRFANGKTLSVKYVQR